MKEKKLFILDILEQKGKIVIGRSTECDVTINDEYVSRKHLVIWKEGATIYAEDLNSTNGTYINGIRLTKKAIISSNDEILIGFNLLYLQRETVDLNEFSAIEINNVSVKIKNKTILQPLSLSIKKGEFWAIMGPSGSGKSTIIKALSGYLREFTGKILIHGLDIVKYGQFLNKKVSYVSQHDNLHSELTVFQELWYTAKLKLERKCTDSEIREKIHWALKTVNLDSKTILNKKIKVLSGGETKRVSIALELLNDPTILLLDEPTSPLDPETIKEFMQCLKDIQKNGTTIILVTHKPDDLYYADKVLFLGQGGYATFFGKKENLLAFFEKDNIHEVYEIVNDIDVTKKFYEKINFINLKEQKVNGKRFIHSQKKSIFTSIYHLKWLILRYAEIKINSGLEYWFVVLMQPVVISFLIYYIFDKLQISVFFIMVLSAIWFGVSNSAREIVDELSLLIKERKFGIGILPFLLSKITILFLITSIQVFILTYITVLLYKNDELNIFAPTHFLFTLSLVGFSSVLLGLFISSLFRDSIKVMSIIPLVLIPQIMLAGIISPMDNKVKEVLSYFTFSRWGVELLCRVQDDCCTYEENYTKIFNPKYDTTFTKIFPCKHIPCYGSNLVEIDIPEKITINYDKYFYNKKASVYTLVPEYTKDTLIINSKQDTLAMPLNSYTYEKKLSLSQLQATMNKSNLFNFFDSYNKNLLAKFILNLIFFASCVLRLIKLTKI